jgi:RNA polymerase sigma-70 factor (ECF subfamily)
MDPLGERLARGEPEAFAELYAACADPCHHYLTVLLGSRHAADDVLQETFVRLARAARKLAGVENLRAYVFTVARREAARHAGRQAREAGQRVWPAAEDLFLEARYEEVAARESAEAVAAVLRRLSDEQREVVELKVYGGLTFREIAEVTGVPLPTAATRYRAALEQLKEWFARQPL